MFFPNDSTPNNTEWHVSEEPRVRLGKGIIKQIRYSPDGTQLAVGSSIGIWIYNTHTGKELNLLTGHTKGAGCIAYSPNGHILASGGAVDTGPICLWDPNTGEHKVTLSEHGERVTCVEFSPDGSILAGGSVDPRGHGTIRLWDVVTGKRKVTLKGHTGGHKLMVFSPDGRTLASADNGGFFGGPMENVEMIRLWNTETGQHITLENPAFRANSIVFSPDGETIATGGWDRSYRELSGTVLLWDAATGEHKGTLIEEYTNSVFTVAYSPNGSSLVSGSKDGTILLWDAITGERKATLTGNPNAIAFSPDSSTLAIAGQDRKIRLWDAVSGDHKLTLTDQTDGVYSLIFNPDGRTFAGIGGDSTIRLWDAVTGQHLQTITGHTGSVSSISFNPDGRTIATGSGQDGVGDKIIRIWNVRSGCLQNTFKVPLGRWIKDDLKTFADTVSYSPDGKTLASASEDGTIRLWDVESGKPRVTTFEGRRGVRKPLQEYSIDGFVLAYSPDGKMLATSSRDDLAEDPTIQLWDAATCKHKATLTGSWEAKTLNSIAFSPDGRTVAGGGNDGDVYLWDAISGELKTTLTGHSERFVMGVAFSPDGRTLASGARASGDGEVYLWDAISGECKASLNMRGDGVSGITFSPDGSALAVGGTDSVTLWDVHKVLYQSTSDDRYFYKVESGGFDVTGRHKTTLKGHTGFVSSVAFSPDGRTLASGGGEGTILLWDITKVPQTPGQIAKHALSSTVVVAVGERNSRRGQGNGFFIRQGLVATYTYLWSLPAGCFAKLAGGWSPFAKNQFIKEGDTGYIELDCDLHNLRVGYNEHEFKVAAIDTQRSLVILKVLDFNYNVQPLYLSDNDNAQIGDTIYVASSPDMFSQGIISSTFSVQEHTFFQITAPIPDGCNGCPVLNNKGQVIGIAARKIRIAKQFQHQNYNFVIPSYYLRELLSKVEKSS